MRNLSFKKKQYLRAETLIKTSYVFDGDLGNGVFRRKSYPFILLDSNNNLFAHSRNAVLEYFRRNGIAWWSGKLTNHALSSQIACLNHLFPIREDREAVLSLVKNICPDLSDVLEISTDKNMPAYIQFEAVSDIDHLNEMKSTRGSKCTSIDALIYGVHKDGRKILFPIEWKYVEAYSNENKAKGDRGIIRKARYTELINKSSQLKVNFHDVYYFEPFYQLMRQTLWAEQMIANKTFETIKADDYIHIHVIPSENRQLLKKNYPCSKMEMEETWRSCLKNQNKYIIISPKEFLTPVIGMQHGDLLDYLNNRYW
ncbi:PGN_0703 family putative restriction endonuclease [Neobacillus sp. LXY-4]|uniref:PGN_0703 family putative restriction endonuclease n=1 Tax=Neobacillus sp. LXY-4 TaxID=3379826 RepID=UPI003EE0D752